MGRLKYCDVRLNDGANARSFRYCKEAADWLTQTRQSKSWYAARVGISEVLTGKRDHYKGYRLNATLIERY